MMPTLRSVRRITVVFAALFAVTLTACGGSSPSSPTISPAFSQVDLIVGTGATAASGNRVTVAYTGWLYDASKTDNKGTAFDSNANYSFILGAGAVIKGWDQGVVGMKVGGQRRLIIPPDLAYGSTGAGGGVIPPNASLVFDVSLLGVQ